MRDANGSCGGCWRRWGIRCKSLVRTDIGAVTLGNQRPGSLRPLRNDEIGQLYKAVGL